MLTISTLGFNLLIYFSLAQCFVTLTQPKRSFLSSLMTRTYHFNKRSRCHLTPKLCRSRRVLRSPVHSPWITATVLMIIADTPEKSLYLKTNPKSPSLIIFVGACTCTIAPDSTLWRLRIKFSSKFCQDLSDLLVTPSCPWPRPYLWQLIFLRCCLQHLWLNPLIFLDSDIVDAIMHLLLMVLCWTPFHLDPETFVLKSISDQVTPPWAIHLESWFFLRLHHHRPHCFCFLLELHTLRLPHKFPSSLKLPPLRRTLSISLHRWSCDISAQES